MKHNNLKSLCYYIAQCEQSNKIYKKENRNIITANDFTTKDVQEISITAEKIYSQIINSQKEIKTYRQFEKLIKNLMAITKHYTYNIKIQNEILKQTQITI